MSEHPTSRWAWLTTLPALLLLGVLVGHWTASQASGRVVQLGEALWEGYASELRRDAPPPEPPKAESARADDDLIGDLLGDDEPQADDDLIGDLLADEPAAPGEPGADDALIADLLGDQDAPKADDALIDDLLGKAPSAPAVDEAAARYERQRAAWEDAQARVTGSVKAFRTLDHAVSDFAVWGTGQFKNALVFLILLCGVTATARRHHIALRPVRNRFDDRIAEGSQLVANLLVVASQLALYQSEQASGTDISDPGLPLLWATGFGLMAAVNVLHLARPSPSLPSEGGSIAGGLLGVPLYASMALLSSAYFLGVESYPEGLAVYTQKLVEHAQLYLFVGLYVWTGMLLKRTRIAHLAFETLKPWKLTPELLAIVVVVAAAIPTAYSGASGIFVIAVGGLIYAELIAAGARPQFALAATAMSGSLGVVLRPCLLVVIVAYLNPVTTDVLYSWGKWVFVLSAALFAVGVVLTRDNPLHMATPKAAFPGMMRAIRALVPYIVVCVALLLGYWLVLDAGLDEHTAPLILPVLLLAVMAIERFTGETSTSTTDRAVDATSETTIHIGALLLLMALSIALGGVFERGDLMGFVPQDLGSTWVAMGVLVVVLVIIGMTMDPYGAVILVSATLAGVAYDNGIGEAHFWMVVLVAFELGYLTPPVALNHLLARQVVGAEAFDEAAAAVPAGATFWRRHERILLPLTVMAVALVLVAFVPLLVGG